MACCIAIGILVSAVAGRLPFARYFWKKSLVKQEQAVQWAPTDKKTGSF